MRTSHIRINSIRRCMRWYVLVALVSFGSFLARLIFLSPFGGSNVRRRACVSFRFLFVSSVFGFVYALPRVSRRLRPSVTSMRLLPVGWRYCCLVGVVGVMGSCGPKTTVLSGRGVRAVSYNVRVVVNVYVPPWILDHHPTWCRVLLVPHPHVSSVDMACWCGSCVVPSTTWVWLSACTSTLQWTCSHAFVWYASSPYPPRLVPATTSHVVVLRSFVRWTTNGSGWRRLEPRDRKKYTRKRDAKSLVGVSSLVTRTTASPPSKTSANATLPSREQTWMSNPRNVRADCIRARRTRHGVYGAQPSMRSSHRPIH